MSASQQYKITFSITHSLILRPYVSACIVRMLLVHHFEISLTRHLLRMLFILIWYNLIHYGPAYVSWRCEWTFNSKQFKTQQMRPNYIHPLGTGFGNKNHSTQDFTHNNVCLRCADWLICTVLNILLAVMYCVYNTINARSLLLLPCNCWRMLSLHT